MELTTFLLFAVTTLVVVFSPGPAALTVASQGSAIFPQFLNINQPIATQILIMGLTTICLDIMVYSVYAYLGYSLSKSSLKTCVIKTLNSVAGTALLFAAFKMTKVNN